MSTNEAMQLQQHVCVCVMVLGGERLERLDLKVKLQCHLRTTRWCCMLPPEYVLELRHTARSGMGRSELHLHKMLDYILQ